jgi:hypothetical protein
VRYGDVVSVSAHLRAEDGNGEDVGEDAGVDVCCVVPPESAVALDSTVAVSFAPWASADVGMLQSSRKSVHLRSGAPIVGIAWLHCLSKPVCVQVGRPGVQYDHGVMSGNSWGRREVNRRSMTRLLAWLFHRSCLMNRFNKRLSNDVAKIDKEVAPQPCALFVTY